MMQSTVLVTGADGLLGSHLVRRLLQKEFNVRTFLHPGSSSPTLDGLELERFVGDLTLDDDGLAGAVRGAEYVFHCAAITDMWCPPERVWQVNDGGTRRVLEACLTEGVRRLVFTGSASTFQFGSLGRPGDENAPYPAAYRGIAYMESKQRATQRVLESVRDRGLDAVVVAPTFLLGSMDWRPSSGELIRQFLQRGLRFASPGGRSFAYAPDVADAMIAAMDQGKKGECYIAGGHNTTYMDFFTQVADIAGTGKRPWANLPGIAVLAAGYAGSLFQKFTGKTMTINRNIARLSLLGTYYSSEKAIRELGMPQTSLEIAIEESVRSLRDYGHIH
jgi:dihydroflavonol-4-reductase